LNIGKIDRHLVVVKGHYVKLYSAISFVIIIRLVFSSLVTIV